MRTHVARGLGAALLLATTSGLAWAADLGPVTKSPTFAPVSFNPWMIRLRGIGVIPGGSNRVTAGGAPLAGAKVDVTNSVVPELDITYFFTPNIAAELILGTTPHTAKGKGAIAGLGTLGKAWLLPPTLTLQYHFTQFGAFKPYIGFGVNYTLFYGEEHGSMFRFRMRDTVGVAAQVGFDYMINKNWGFNVDVKKIWLEPNVSVGSGAVTGKVKIDPWLIGAGITYKF